ncbi:MAG TPA: DUF6600 domain-containing protein [Stellaceae bacterium]|jgi:hypothetical protein
MRLLSGCVFAAGIAIAAAASAQNNKTVQAAVAGTSAAPAPPTRVGRVSLVAGKAGFRSAREALWSDAVINDPISAGASLRTDPLGRAEMRIGADTIDLTDNTEILIAKLDDHVAEIALRRGRVDLDIPQIGADETIAIDFPGGAVRLLKPGRYDVDAGAGDQPPRIAAFTGGAQLLAGGLDVPLKAGDAMVLGGSDPAHAAVEPATADEFAQWCGSRAIDEAKLAAPYYVSPAMTGFAELDAAGRWRTEANSAEVWVPNRLPVGWAPFRDGHWRWVAPWGWTWIDDQPWGFATSHYGRWAFRDGRWVWAPGAFSAHPVYAPALVAFLGTPGVGLSYADSPGPAIAWFPLTMGEFYWPSYTGDLDAIRALNRGDVADLGVIRLRADGEPPAEIADAHFANRQFASVVPRPVFVAGEPVAPALLQLPLRRLQDAPAIMGSPRIGPPPPATPVRVVAAPAIRQHLPAAHVAALAAKRAAWAGIVRVAAVRVRNYRRSLLLRAAHLRLPGYAALRLRHTIVLRVAGAWHVLHRAKGRKEEITR